MVFTGEYRKKTSSGQILYIEKVDSLITKDGANRRKHVGIFLQVCIHGHCFLSGDCYKRFVFIFHANNFINNIFSFINNEHKCSFSKLWNVYKTTTLNLHVIVRMIQGKFYKILDFS